MRPVISAFPFLTSMAVELFVLGIATSVLAGTIQLDSLGGGTYQIDYFEPIGQSFLAEDSNVSIALNIKAINPSSPNSDPLSFSLYEGDGFNGSLLDSQEFVVSDDFEGWYDVDFSSNDLNVGTTYTVGATVLGTSPFWGVRDSNSTYENGSGYLTYLRSPLYEGESGFDLAFRVTPVVEPKLEPRTFGLFVGGNSGKDLRADTMASLLYKVFPTEKSQKLLLTDSAGRITEGKIQDAIAGFDFQPEDKFLLYIAGHGFSDLIGFEEVTETTNSADEVIQLGNAEFLGIPNPDTLLNDNELTNILQNTDKYENIDEVSKWVILDACASGGFIGDFKAAEISNINVLASAPELGNMYYSKEKDSDLFGLPFFSYILGKGFVIDKSTGFSRADTDGRNGISFEELASWMIDGPAFDVKDSKTDEKVNILTLIQLYEGGFGDPVSYSPDMYSPVFYQSPDAQGSLFAPAEPVPSPLPSSSSAVDFWVSAGTNESAGRLSTVKHIDTPKRGQK